MLVFFFKVHCRQGHDSEKGCVASEVTFTCYIHYQNEKAASDSEHLKHLHPSTLVASCPTRERAPIEPPSALRPLPWWPSPKFYDGHAQAACKFKIPLIPVKTIWLSHPSEHRFPAITGGADVHCCSCARGSLPAIQCAMNRLPVRE